MTLAVKYRAKDRGPLSVTVADVLMLETWRMSFCMGEALHRIRRHATRHNGHFS